MKNYTLAFACLLLSIVAAAQPKKSPKPLDDAPLSIIPLPMKIARTVGNFAINNRTKIIVPNGNAEFRRVAQLLADRLNLDGSKVAVVDINNSKSTDNAIFFLKTESVGGNTEGYKLSVQTKQINISMASAAGAFYAVQTLFQLLPNDIYSTKSLKKIGWRVPCVEIEDQPRYAYRGLHLDVGRHFSSVSFVKKFIDLMAMHKFNNFHWHLTEDQGWRIEIKKYPKLTEIGSQRKETLIGSYADRPQRFDGQPYGGFYTQAEIREVVAYAAARFINIVPEIEMPGHALAALSAYPELSCDASKTYEAATKWGIFEDVFCPSETTFSFLQDVLTEVMDLFPSKYIHIGGDECPKTAWKKSAFCQDLMKKLGLKDEHELQSYFIQRIEKFVNAKGRSIIGWDEILEGGLAPNATVMSWRGVEGGIAAAQQNHDVIMSPSTYFYLDYYQASPETEPLAIGGFLPLEKVYSYEPTPDILTAEQARHIVGAQANIWTEYLPTPAKIEYMAFPRALAVAEVVWSPKSARNFTDFTRRLTAHFGRLDQLNVNYALRLFDVKQTLKIENATPSVYLSSSAENSEIHYTTDGDEPRSTSPIYTKAIDIQRATTVRAAIFQNGKLASGISTQSFYPHSALGATYDFTTPPKNTYASGKMGLTNGLRGSEKSNDQWTGFQGNDMETVFDFGNPRSFQEVKLQFLNKPSSWVFLPDYVIVSVSSDGKTWLDINRVDFEHNRSLEKTYTKEARLPFSEYTKPKRFLKIYAKNMGVCPKGHAGEGQAAWLFADEIIVD